MAYTTIDKPTDYFSVNLWVADDASSRALTGFGHQPDLVWTKHRGSGSINPTITDSVRGGDKQLATATTAAEDAGSHGKISAFGTDGITVIDGTSGSYPKLYFNDLNPFGASVGGNYVGWSWKAGGSASSNSNGSITSSVSANQDAGFSIVSYTGTASAGATVGHGLGVKPDMIITKARAIADNWGVYHKSLGATKGLYLNTTNAQITSSAYYNNTEPTSTLVTLGDNEATNDNDTMIMYAFAEKKGYSKFGSYTGNGNADGTFVYTGFKPAFVMIKQTTSATDWFIVDNKRQGYNVVNKILYPNGSFAEGTADVLDFTAQGFKLRSSNNTFNKDGNTFIFMAFSESSFVNSSGVANNAR